jgi:hypothetical protein
MSILAKGNSAQLFLGMPSKAIFGKLSNHQERNNFSGDV